MSDVGGAAQRGPGIEAVVVPRTRDLGGLQVARVLPAMERRMVGPFVFLDAIVSNSRDRIEQAAADWRAGRFPAIPGERDPIPLPERPPGLRIR